MQHLLKAVFFTLEVVAGRRMFPSRILWLLALVHGLTLSARSNQSPVADAGGPYVTTLGDGVTLNGTGSFDPDAGSGDHIVSYAWDVNNDGTYDFSGTGATTTLTPVQLSIFGLSAVGTYTIRLRVTDTFGATGTATTTLTIQPATPAITSQPASRTNDAGTTATFAVTATGAPPLNYRWRKYGVPLPDSGNVSGATTGTLTLSNVQPGDAGDYSVVITNASGSVTSSVATLTVETPLGAQPDALATGTDQPLTVSTATVLANDAVTGNTPPAPLGALASVSGSTVQGGTVALLWSSGVPLWTNRFDSPAHGDEDARGLAVDTNGNTFVTGQSRTSNGTAYATIAYSGAGTPLWTNYYNAPGNGDVAPVAIAAGGGRVFVTGTAWQRGAYATVAYSTAGTALWTNLYQSAGSSVARALSVDASGNVYVTGQSQAAAFGNDDYLTVAYSGSGTPLWTNRYNGSGNNQDQAFAIAVDNSNRVFVTGRSFAGGTYDTADYLTIAYSSAGVPLWTNRYNGPGSGFDAAFAIATDGTNVFVTGNSTAFGGVNSDFATLAYSSSGTPLWTNRYHGPVSGSDGARTIAVDSLGHVVVCGDSQGTAFSDFATVAYSASGVPLWTNRYNGPGSGYDIPITAAADRAGHFFVSGYTDTGAGKNYTLLAYSSAGAPLWTNLFDGGGVLSFRTGLMAVDNEGNVLAAGTSSRTSTSDFVTVKYAMRDLPARIVYTPPAGFTGTDTFSYVLTNARGSSFTGTVSVLVGNYPPTVQTQPQSLTIPAGGSGSLSVTPLGAPPLAYQWRQNGSPIQDNGWSVFDADSPTLTLSRMAMFLAGDYDVVVSNSWGSVTSAVATVSVACPTIQVSGDALPLELHHDYTFDPAGNFAASGGTGLIPFQFSDGTPPPGMGLRNDGPGLATLTGIPTALGTYVYTVRAVDQFGCTGSLTVTQTVSCPAISLSPPALMSAMAGEMYHQTLSATEAGASFPSTFNFGVTQGTLPPGLMLSANGFLAGMPLVPGTFNFTISATNTDGGCVAAAPYSIDVGSTLYLASLTPASAQTGGSGLSLAVSGDGFANGAVVLWNGAPRPTTFISANALEAAIPASDLVLTVPGIQTVAVAVQNLNSVVSTPRAFTIVGANVGTSSSEVARPGQTATASVPPPNGNQAGVTATVNNSTGGAPVAVTAATYTSNPGAGTTFDAGSSFVDVQVSGVTSNSSLTANFYYPAAVTGAAEDALELLYYTGTGWSPVRGSGGTVPLKDTTDNLDGTLSGGRFTVVFDATSEPSITQLTGTPFALALDSTPPTIHCPANIEVLVSEGQSGASVSFTVTSSDNSGSTAISANPPSGSVFPLGPTTVHCVATDPAGHTASCSFEVTVVTARLPEISSPPQSRTNWIGEAASFSVVASGTPTPGYQWRHGGAAIPGGTNATFTIASCAWADAGSYDVIASNSVGSVTSVVATLTILLPSPTIAQPPKVVGGSFIVTFAGVPNAPYWIESRTDLRTGTWQNFTNVTASLTGEILLSTPVAAAPTRFFRVVPAQ